jgi:ribosomal protein S18 acetylase RimI-like enzyme
VKIVEASSFDNARLAELFEAGYEGYFVPIHVDEAAFAYMVDAWDVDLDRSCVALDDGGAPVGVTMLGVRGDEGWIGGLGVRASHRRRGVGRALMDAAVARMRELGYEQATLWVLDGNERARRFYEKHGWRADSSVKLDDRGTFQLRELRYGRPL